MQKHPTLFNLTDIERCARQTMRDHAAGHNIIGPNHFLECGVTSDRLPTVWVRYLTHLSINGVQFATGVLYHKD